MLTNPRRLRAVICLIPGLGVAAAQAQASTRAATTGRPALAVVISLDGLSWERLDYYRPWYAAGLKRLLDEGQVEAGARYLHLNTETSPGHAALSTGAPPRVTGVVANRWIEKNPDGSLRSLGAAQQWATDAVPGQPPLFYREIEKEGRLYVFAMSREFELWEKSGETGRATVRFGAGVPLVFWGGPFEPGWRDRETTPYDLAPTLAGLLGIRLPNATGRSLLDAR